MIKEVIKDYISKNNSLDVIKVWYIKEVLQTYVLDFIYSSEKYKDLIFYWWTSLRFLFNLNRLSEDLDFIWENFSDFEELWHDLQIYFKKEYNLDLDYKLQKFRITLKFKNFLNDYNLSYWNSNNLFLKIEISDNFHFCKNYKVKKYPIFKLGKVIIIKSLNIDTLFATKINAVLYRKWTKTSGNVEITMKWRDIYDLFWYISNKYKVNIDCVEWISSKEELIIKLIQIINQINFTNITLDIENFLEDRNVLEFFKIWAKQYILDNIENI